MGNAVQGTSLYSVGCCDLKFFRGGGDTFLRLCCQLGTKTSEKREVSQDLQDCSLLMAIKHHCYTEFTVLLNLTVIIIMLPKGWFSYDCYDRWDHWRKKKFSYHIDHMETTLQRLQWFLRWKCFSFQRSLSLWLLRLLESGFKIMIATMGELFFQWS